jgi:hypothetical protein
LIVNKLFGQITISGHVISDDIYGEESEQPGATITELNTTNSVISGINGEFSILVNDTSKIIIKFVGCYDKIFKASEFHGDTIKLENDDTAIEELERHHITFYPSSTVELYSDFNLLPYGISISHYRPYFFKRRYSSNEYSLSIFMTFLTDFKLNTDFYAAISSDFPIIRLQNLRTTSSFNYHYRNMNINNNELRIDDYELSLLNRLFSFLYVYGGILYRNNIKIDDKNIYAMLGLSKSIKKINFYGDLTFIDNNFEYSLSASRSFYRILHGFSIEIRYNNYIEYDELKFRLSYRISKH